MKKQISLPQTGVNLVPFNLHPRNSTQTEEIDRPKWTRMPDVECGVEHIYSPQPIEVEFRVLELIVQTLLFFFEFD